MNERIRELVKKAVEAVDIVTGNEALDNELAKMYIPDCFSEKFAELIVQECIEQCSKALVEHTGQPSVTHNYAVGLCQDNIKEHFGVEE